MKSNLHEDQYAIFIYLAHFSLKGEIFSTNFVTKIKAHTMFKNVVSKNQAVYEIMWKNVVQPDRPQMTTCMLDA
jgi:hypothetical protein